MNGTIENTFENTAVSYLPMHIANAIRNTDNFSEGIFEIRLTVGAHILLTTRYGLRKISAVFSAEDMRQTLRSLCGNSVYSHSESIKEGYITTTEGIRVGIAGRAVSDKGIITAVTDVGSIVMRIPHRFPGAAMELYSLMERFDFKGSVLVYSPPGGGKTTILRELAITLAQEGSCERVAVVDSRCELSLGFEGLPITTLCAYPRHKGIEIAVRTLGADIVICDEISTKEDAEASLECLGAGVTLVASVHGSVDDVFQRTVVKELHRQGLFKAYYGLERDNSHGRINLAREIVL